VTDSLLDAPVVFVDVETTGGHPALHRIIEVGLVATQGAELEYQWSTLVNPGVAIPRHIEQFTGITNEMVREAPTFEDIAAELLKRFDGRLFVAHNARFDYGFCRGEYRRLGHNFTSRVACTVKLSRRLHPELPKHNLDAVIEHHGLDCPQRHRALPDAAALWQFWRAALARHGIEGFEAALRDITRRPSTPPHLPSDLIDDLPEAHGVYRFYGERETLLYVGKANNIRERVLQHWQAVTQDEKSHRLFEQTRRVDWTETAGELGALLLEARTVRERQPVYNRKLRGNGCTYTWLVPDDGRKPLLVPLDWTTIDAGDLFGLYRTERQAREMLLATAREQRLCLKVLGLESTSGSCFGYQVGRCKGACVGAEPLELHAMRLKLALADRRLKPWPFGGPIGLREASVNGLEHVHVIDRWQHLATLDANEPLRELSPPLRFDVDAYKILLRHLRPGEGALRVVKVARAGRLRERHDPADAA
jgi:DNA polymerase-3 subunit epsilon